MGVMVRTRRPRARGKPLVVLIVEDDPGRRGVISKFLLSKGHLVHESENGFDALNTLKQERPLLVLMDIDMPGLDGVEAARLAAEFDPQVKIILISGFNERIVEAIQLDLEVFTDFEKTVPMRALGRFVDQARGFSGP